MYYLEAETESTSFYFYFLPSNSLMRHQKLNSTTANPPNSEELIWKLTTKTASASASKITSYQYMSWGTKHLVNREKNKGEKKKGCRCSSGRKYSTILFVNSRELHKVHHISIRPYYILIIERPRNDICKSNIARIFM